MVVATSVFSYASASLYPFLDYHCYQNEGALTACDREYQPSKEYLDRFLPGVYDKLQERITDSMQRAKAVEKVHSKILEKVKTKTDKQEIFVLEYIAYTLGLYAGEETGYQVTLNKGQASHNYGEVAVAWTPSLTQAEKDAIRTQTTTKADTSSTVSVDISVSDPKTDPKAGNGPITLPSETAEVSHSATAASTNR